MPKLIVDLNLGPIFSDEVHGWHSKDLIVLHETVSSNYSGLGDIKAVSQYLDKEGYAIHGITDNDGNIAYARSYGKAIFYHTDSNGGMVNTRGIGIEQISRVMLDYTSTADKIKAWLHMDKELNATAKLVAAISNTWNIPLLDSGGHSPGITTHWEVTKNFNVVGGHTDCWPIKYGGYYPKWQVIQLAKHYKALGYRL